MRRDLVAELPFTLMHPKSEEDTSSISVSPTANGNGENENDNDNLEIVPVDNLIQLYVLITTFDRRRFTIVA